MVSPQQKGGQIPISLITETAGRLVWHIQLQEMIDIQTGVEIIQDSGPDYGWDNFREVETFRWAD